MESSFQRSVFPAIARADDGESSMRLAETSRMRSSASRKTDVISPMARDSPFWAETREEVDRLARLVRKIGGKCLEGPDVCRAYSRGYYACFFEDPAETKLRIF